jgi:hypothetical protein
VAHHAPAMVPVSWAGYLGVRDQFGVIVADGRKMADVETVETTGGVAHPVRGVTEEVLRSIGGIPYAVLRAVPSCLVEAALFAVDAVADHEDDAYADPDNKDSGCCDDNDP